MKRPLLLLALSGVGFVALGLPDGVTGVAWPSMRATFALPLDALGALLVAYTTGYVASSFASGRLIERMTIGSLLAVSCAFTALGLLGYSVADSWPGVVALGALAGLGAGAIDAGINTYVATHHSARTLGLLHAAYGLGTTAGPLWMTSVLMAGESWRFGYAALGGLQAALALGFAASRRVWPAPVAKTGSAAPGEPAAFSARCRPVAALGVTTFFLYVGLEATAGAWTFTLLAGGRGYSMAVAGAAVSGFWGGLMAGRIALALVPVRFAPDRLLGGCTLGATAAAIVLAADLGPAVSGAAIAAIGVAAGPIFPLLIATTPQRVGSAHAGHAVGFQVAASALGQSLMPAGVGWVAGMLGLEAIARALPTCAVLLVVAHRALARATRVERGPGDPRGSMAFGATDPETETIP